ncbi:MAG: OmpH family outer membrane protein [Candidatus Ratteibacteria bacterium]|jgi:Skp family chaperone for outer membrane proteins
MKSTKIRYASIIVAAVLFFSVTGRAVAKDSAKIAYIDEEKVFSSYGKTEEVQKQFDKERVSQESSLAKLQEELKKMHEDIEKQKDLLKPEEKQKKEDEIRVKTQELIEADGRIRQTLQAMKVQMITDIRKEIKEAVKALALKEKYDYVLEYQVIHYGPEGDDLTQKVIEYLNKPVAKK